MTWGALGTSSRASLDVLRGLMDDCKVPVTAHLTCVGQTNDSIRETIDQLHDLGIRQFLALRGDAQKAQMPPNGLEHASELVAILAEQTDRDISVAAYPEQHPESPDAKSDLYWLKHKLDTGANRAITQFFFEAETFLRFRDAAVRAGIRKPLVPGILPIHDINKVKQFSEQCGATLPSALIKRFESVGDAESKAQLAVEQSVELCQALQEEGVGEFHIYTLNQSDLSYRLAKALTTDQRKVGAAA
jgi:methylenetetrahydrofolate reductase (NADPH)